MTATQSEVNASSDVDGGAGARNAAADSQVDDVVLDLAVLIPGVLDLTADVLLTSSTSSGDFGALVSTPFADIQELNITALGNVINPTGTPAPNTVLFDSLGLTIIVNEQIFGGDGTAPPRSR